MNIILKLPSLPTNQLSLQKINQNVYFDSKSHKFYRLSFHPEATIFKQQDLVIRKVSILTPYDPYFLLLEFISRNHKVIAYEIPEYLQHLQISKLCNQSGQNWVINKTKIENFLEQKAMKVSQVIRDKQLKGPVIKKIKEESLVKDAIDLMRVEVPQYWFQFLDKLQQTTDRKLILPSVEEPEKHNSSKPKPAKKSAPKAPIVNVKEHKSMDKWIIKKTKQ